MEFTPSQRLTVPQCTLGCTVSPPGWCLLISGILFLPLLKISGRSLCKGSLPFPHGIRVRLRLDQQKTWKLQHQDRQLIQPSNSLLSCVRRPGNSLLSKCNFSPKGWERARPKPPGISIRMKDDVGLLVNQLKILCQKEKDILPLVSYRF